MAVPKVTIDNLDTLSGSPAAVENHFLFIGVATSNPNTILAVNAKSDFDQLLGTGDSLLKQQLTTARLNADSRWTALVATLSAADEWQQALQTVVKKKHLFEAAIICQEVTEQSALTAMNNAAVEILNATQRRFFIATATPGINSESQTWADYLDIKKTLTNGLVAGRVLVVPLLFGADLGSLAGRLAKASVAVADSPMRVQTGPLVGISEADIPMDKDGEPLDLATLTELDKARLSVPYWFDNLEGIYWADANLLAEPISDYKVVERLRVADKAARRMLPEMIRDVANRRLNSTAASLANAKTRYMKPLRQMSRPITVNGEQMPGDIQPPRDEDIVLTFTELEKVKMHFVIRPYNSAKDLEGSIILDLSLEETA